MNETDTSLDADVLAELLACDPSGELLIELIDVYLEDTPPRLNALRRAFDAGDARAMGDQAHALKSSCAQLGAMNLSSACRELERMGREGRLDGAEALLAGIESDFPRARAALLARRAAGPG